MATTFRKDHNSQGQIERQPSYSAHLRRVAAEVAQSVQTVAPDETGYYKRSIRTVGTDVISTDAFAHLVEWGSINNIPYAPMRRGVLALGLRFVPRPK